MIKYILLLTLMSSTFAVIRNVVYDDIIGQYNLGGWLIKDLYCPLESYAIGYQMKIQPYQQGIDNTALNAIKLECAFKGNYTFAGYVINQEGPWGDWSSMSKCNNGDFIRSVTIQVQEYQGSGDDTSANYVKFKCGSYDGSTLYEISVPPGYGEFGNYTEWTNPCPSQSAICGMAVHLQPNQTGTPNADNVAVTAIGIYCCDD